MNTTNYPITPDTDSQGNLLWCVGGKCFKTKREALERQRQLEEDLQAPPTPPGGGEPDDEEFPAVPFFNP